MPLGELGYFYGGLSGKSKEDFIGGRGKFIPYMNVFSNLSIDIEQLGLVSIKEGERQNKVEYGDILFTASSETPDECGMSSVMLSEVEDDNPVYLNSFCFGFRFNDKSQIVPSFYKHLFRSNKMREEISRTAQGVTRFNISKKTFAKIIIPVPSIEQQENIANELDTFTTLIEKLGEEIELRKKQLEYLREEILSFKNRSDVKKRPLGEICEIERGNGVQKTDFVEEGVGCIHYGQIYTHYNLFATKTNRFVSNEVALRAKKAEQGDVVMTITSENIEDVCKCVAWLGDESIAVSAHAVIIKNADNSKYIAYCSTTHDFFLQKRKLARGAKVVEIKPEMVAKIEIPYPSKKEQDEIVEKLDAFTTLISKLEEERDLRQKQYEYYREKLLTFE